MNKHKIANVERNVCRKRQSMHVFEPDRHGYYNVEVFDPLGSVISYLRECLYRSFCAQDGQNADILDAIQLCTALYNGGVI